MDLMSDSYIIAVFGSVAEWLKALVLKTSDGVTCS